ncbi:MAG: ribonuclease H-like domain-containing protein [Bacillota bacterium]
MSNLRRRLERLAGPTDRDESRFAENGRRPIPADFHRDGDSGIVPRRTVFHRRDLTAHHLIRDMDLLGSGESPEDLTEIVLLDLETTGLSRGTGTLPFLSGTATLGYEGIRVVQYFLSDPAHESAYLAAVSDHLRDYRHVVTFNGKSFDLPLLQNRYTLNRMEAPCFSAHSDLLPPARRLWSQVLSSCSLTSLEEHILGRPRAGDIPGSEIPARYFDYLAGGSTDMIDEIVRHNELDLLATADLLFRILRPLGEPTAAAEHLAIARMASKCRRQRLAQEQLETAADRAVGERDYLGALRELGFLWRRRGDYEKAAPLWRQAVELIEAGITPPYPISETHVEVAKYAEHHIGDLEMALDYTNRALALLQSRCSQFAREVEDLEYRRARLLRRMGHRPAK